MNRAMEIVRRRIAAAPDAITRVRWMVLQKMLEEGSTFDRAGQIVDEGGDLFVYFVGDYFCTAAETGGSVLPHIHVNSSWGGMNLDVYLQERLEQSKVFVEKLAKLYPDDIIKAVIGCEG